MFTADFLDTTNICFGITVLGQIVLSAAQPFYFNVPPKVSARWFPPAQRTVTSSIMSLTQPLGSAMVCEPVTRATMPSLRGMVARGQRS